jgi:amino acid transporter
LPLRSWFQPYLAWICIGFFSTVLIFNGFTSFIGGFQVSNFFAAYVTLPLIAICWLGFKIVRKTTGVRPENVDLSGGPAEALQGTAYDVGHGSGYLFPATGNVESIEEKA